VVLATLDFIVSLAVQHHHLLDMERARYSPIGWICLTGSYCPLGSSLPIYVQLVLLTIILKLHQYLIAPTVLLDTFVKDSGIHNQVVSVKKAPIVCWDRPLLLLFKSLTILFLEIILEEISVQLIIIVLQAPLMLVVVHLEPIGGRPGSFASTTTTTSSRVWWSLHEWSIGTGLSRKKILCDR
jgi:hypothetical protein